MNKFYKQETKPDEKTVSQLLDELQQKENRTSDEVNFHTACQNMLTLISNSSDVTPKRREHIEHSLKIILRKPDRFDEVLKDSEDLKDLGNGKVYAHMQLIVGYAAKMLGFAKGEQWIARAKATLQRIETLDNLGTASRPFKSK